jgi:glycosyltransferase involved in cell wall biosynthesis
VKTPQRRSHTVGRILILITTLTFGGAETQVSRLAIELRRRGWAVRVVCMTNPDAFVQQLEDEDVEVTSLGMPRGIPDPRAIWRLRRIVRTFKPDIVHAHMVHANLLGRIARLFCPIPALICTAHNLRESSEKGGGTWHKELLYRMTDSLADRTTIICKAAFDRYVKVRAVPASRFELIPNGVDTARFRPSTEARETERRALDIKDQFVWLAVGRLVEQKDYFTLLKAIRQLNGREWLLLIAGDGPLSAELQEEARRLKVDHQVRFLGARENIQRLYNAADALVMSSKYEGLSVALLEAASAGLPCVVTDVGGNAEAVVHAVTGYVVPPADAAALAVAMQNLQDLPPEARHSLGRAARHHCVSTFCLDKITDRWIELYARYMPERRAKGQHMAVGV